METDWKQVELIEAYLKGDLSGEENEQVEEKYRQDPVFAQQLDDLWFARETSILAGKNEAIQDIKQISANYHFQNRSKKERQVIWLAAAILLLLISAVVIGLNLFRPPAHERLYANHFSPYEDLLSVMAATPEQAALLEGMEYYNQGKYEKALSLLTTIPDSFDQKPLVDLYIGIAEMESGNPTNAIDTFETLLSDKDSDIYWTVMWYNGLAQLKAGKVDQARESFQKITKAGQDYSDQAKQILEEMG